MSETIRLVVTKFNHESLTIFSILLVLIFIILVAYWFYNRKKFHDLTHQVPAAVVKTYLDTIIQNSNSLKSSLFRGGGLDIANGIPSVVPLSDLPSSGVSVGGGEDLNQKLAEIASLNQKLGDKQKHISDLEKRLQDLSSGKSDGGQEVETLRQEIGMLSKKLKDAEAKSGGDPELGNKVKSLESEKESLQEKLREYEIIEEDLANLKRLQQENEQLKNEIEMLKKGQGANPAPTPAPAAVAAPVAAAVIPDTVAESEIDLEAEMAKAIAESMPKKVEEAPKTMDVDDIPANEGEQKSAEELLSEFEKMLG